MNHLGEQDRQQQQQHFITNAEQYCDEIRKNKKRSFVNHKDNSPSAVKRTVKYLSVCPHPGISRAVVRTAPASVIKTIANAAYNIERGDVHLTPAQQELFRKHRKAIAALTSRKVSIERKRKIIGSQSGGFAFLPILIGTALGALGSRLFGGGSTQ